MRELDEAKQEDDHREENEEYVVAVEHDIQFIDEQVLNILRFQNVAFTF